MIFLKKNTANQKVALSLSNNTTISGDDVYFLFEFTNPQTRGSVLFTGEDTSTNPYRYNLFEFTETGSTSVNLTASTINLEPEGWWEYNVYQMSAQTNTSLTGVTGGPIQTGKVYLTGTTVPNGQQTQYSGGSTSRTVYYNA